MVFLVVVVFGGGGGVVVVVVVMVVVDRVAGEVGARVVFSVSCLCFIVFCCNLFHQGMVVLMARAGDRVVVVEGVVIWFHQVLANEQMLYRGVGLYLCCGRLQEIVILLV